MAETKTKKKTTEKKLTKKQVKKIKEAMDEIEQDAKEYIAENTPDENTEFPPIVLPCRHYFKELDRGLNVENLQIAMNHIMESGLELTGIYDAPTMKAVEEFEKKYGGCVNGKFGETELKAYNKLRGVK